jgi:hypothetical protein
VETSRSGRPPSGREALRREQRYEGCGTGDGLEVATAWESRRKELARLAAGYRPRIGLRSCLAGMVVPDVPAAVLRAKR